MSIVILFGLADIICSLSIILLNWGIAVPLAYASMVYLILKAFMYFSDWASFIDLVSAVIIGAAVMGYFGWPSYIAAGWLFQKGLRSIF